MFSPDKDNAKEQKAETSGERVFITIFTGIVCGLLALEIFQDVTPSRLAMVWFFLAYFALTALHEIAHALVARLVGWAVVGLKVGIGPIITRSVWFGVPVEWRLFPIVGLVEVLPKNLQSPRLKNACIYAAGPGVELLIAGLLTAYLGWDTMLSPTDSYVVAGLQATALAAVFGAGFNLIPFSPQPGVVTDGLGICLSPFLTDEHFKRLMAQPALDQGRRLLEMGDPKGAKTIFNDLLIHCPMLLEAHMGLARAQVDLGHAEYALMEFRNVVQALPDSEQERGQIALQQLRDYIKDKP
ncbi:MAG: M50 family metallopeptidase [Myxococcota bacterium]|nr:M50 family metallopeptidase [Myxococcota bacterium]